MVLNLCLFLLHSFVDGDWFCVPAETYHRSLVLSLVYVMVLILLTFFMSWICWNIPDNNFECRWILMCSTFSAIVWVAWSCIACLGKVLPLLVPMLPVSLIFWSLYFFPKVSHYVTKGASKKQNILWCFECSLY